MSDKQVQHFGVENHYYEVTHGILWRLWLIEKRYMTICSNIESICTKHVDHPNRVRVKQNSKDEVTLEFTQVITSESSLPPLICKWNNLFL